MDGSDPLTQAPPPAQGRLALRVSPAAERAIRQGHPWLFDNSIVRQSGEGAPGDLAVVFDERGRFLAVGLFDPTSPLRVRVLRAGEPVTIGPAWLGERLSEALALRGPLLAGGATTGYRLVHGENDGLPGLVVDVYARTLVAKLYTPAWVPYLGWLRRNLADLLPVDRLVLRLSREVRNQAPHLHGLADGMTLDGQASPDPVLFQENGLWFEADVVHGQKTGFFLDQRDNRSRAGELAKGRRVLNVFAYSGGFSVYAARGGAPAVLSIDSSAPALAAAGRNFDHNRRLDAVRACRHTTVVEDAFAGLARLRREGRRFEMVVVDPPSMAKQAGEVERALQAYARLTGLALGVLAPGGVLVMASCSSRVSAELFFATVRAASAQYRRPLRELARTGHALDHPIRMPEAAYLKCLFAEAG